MMICWNPSFSASAMRCSIRLTGRTSPLSPTSPHIHQPCSIAVSTLLLNTAASTLRSIAGSVTRKPPAMFRNTSFAINLKPTRFSITARSIFSLRWSKPVAERWGVPYAAVLTRACVSTRNGRTPSMAALMATPDNPSWSSVRSSSDGLLTCLNPPCSIS